MNVLKENTQKQYDSFRMVLDFKILFISMQQYFDETSPF